MRSIDDLSHAIRPLRSGGEVLVLDTGALIRPESQAMLGAMYSRSSLGVRKLLERIRERGPDAFMQKNYQIGYGHKSIGDLGEAAIFIDGVSMLCAKAIQDFALYRGQESSTRYIDFSNQPFYDPEKCGEAVRLHTPHEKLGEVLENWRAFYLMGFAAIVPDLMRRFPRAEGEDEKDYEKAIKARGFDIMRSFLPAGALTNVAWIGDLRHINDHLHVLRHHPLEEVRRVAEAIEDALIEKFPSSFGKKRYDATEQYLEEMAQDYYFVGRQWPDFELAHDGIDLSLLPEYREAFQKRPAKTELPYRIRECGTMRFHYLLDFGSFRDLQRQRAVTTRMPFLTSDFGFEEWYLSELPEKLREEAERFITRQMIVLDAIIKPSALDQQYCLPMGMRTPIRTTGDLRALVYLVELRSTRFVHPTLRKRAQQKAAVLTERFGRYGLQLHLDADPDRFDVRRGTHDIVEKI